MNVHPVKEKEGERISRHLQGEMEQRISIHPIEEGISKVNQISSREEEK